MATTLKLAISKIGDLLLEDTITQDDRGKAIKNIELNIPNYQRPYKWTAKNVIQLLDDIIEAKNQNKETYRVGTLILHNNKKNEEKPTLDIVDGQQRTISFSLLLTAFDQENNHVKFLHQRITNNIISFRTN